MTRRPEWLAVLSCLASAVFVTAQESSQGAASDRTRLVAVARVVMASARYCTLVTLGPDGHPQARIVDPLPPEPDMTVWLATNPATRKVSQIREDGRVTLLYFDSAGPAYVTLLGRADVVTDPAEKARHWKEEWAPFYAQGHRGEDFVLLRVVPIRIEVVSYSHGIVGDPGNWRPQSIDFGPSEGEPVAETRSIEALNRNWSEAWLRKDAARVERLSTREYVYVAPNGQILDRDAILAIIRSPSYRLDHGERTELHVTGLAVDAAVVTHRWRGAGSFDGKPFTDDHRCSSVCVRRGQQWLVAWEHCSAVVQ